MLQLDWNATINTLRETLPQTQFQNWVKPVEFIRSNDTCVVLGVPSRFHEEWLRNHYSQRISQAIREQCGAEVQLEFEILSSTEAAASDEPGAAVASSRPRLRIVENKPQEPEISDDDALPPVEPPNVPIERKPYFPVAFNHVAYQCLGMFADRRELEINPLVILGGVGMGKTHLLSELGVRVFRSRPEARVRYTNAETFTNDMFRAIKSNDMLCFKRKYGELTDCLLFDDIHNLAKRQKTQETLLHIFNDILARGGQVAFTTLVAPTRLEDFIEPLRSRLQAGVVAEVTTPTFEDKLKLLTAMAAQTQMTVDTAVLHSLADSGPNDVRKLIGALLQLNVKAAIVGRVLDGEFLAQEGMVREVHQEAITLAEIVGLVEHNFGVSRSDMSSKSRKGNITWARQVAMFLARKFTLMPLEEIGKAFGRDHATVIHAFQKVTETIEQQPTRRYEIEFLKQKIESRTPRAPLI